MSEVHEPSAAIAAGAEALDVALDEASITRLATYVEWLLRWNEAINLVGPCTAHEAVERHVLDALALLRLLDRPEVEALDRPWFDVGSGAGIPGLLLAAARSGMDVHVVEPRGRRATFCKQVAAALGLSNVQVHSARLEAVELPTGSGAISRATFPPETWVERGSAAVGEGGLVLVMMGSGAPESVIEAGWLVDRFELPQSGHARVNALVRGR